MWQEGMMSPESVQAPPGSAAAAAEDWPLVQVNAGTHGGCTHRHIKREVGDVKRRGAHFTL